MGWSTQAETVIQTYSSENPNESWFGESFSLPSVERHDAAHSAADALMLQFCLSTKAAPVSLQSHLFDQIHKLNIIMAVFGKPGG